VVVVRKEIRVLAALVRIVDTECGEECLAEFVEPRGSPSAWLADIDSDEVPEWLHS
jgi:hypothetical protein